MLERATEHAPAAVGRRKEVNMAPVSAPTPSSWGYRPYLRLQVNQAMSVRNSVEAKGTGLLGT
jgi:hypothetical protein